MRGEGSAGGRADGRADGRIGWRARKRVDGALQRTVDGDRDVAELPHLAVYFGQLRGVNVNRRSSVWCWGSGVRSLAVK